MTRVDHYHELNAPRANTIKVAVSAFVLDEQARLLMIRRTDNDLYSIPGGGQEVGETVAQALTRELREETGIDVDVIDLIGIYSDPDHVISYNDGEVRQEFSICFHARPISGELRTSDESPEVLWVSRDKLESLNIHPSIRLRIEHGYANREHPYFS
jgi:8-oxo-dGTP pyrophosphatase MutT (NUDIX family)